MSLFQRMKLVIVETPYKATPYYTQEQHRLYLMHALEDCLKRGEAPFASHHLIPSVLDDDDPQERALGIKCGLEWGRHADFVAVFGDLGISPGMSEAIAHWTKVGKPIEWRKLPHKVVASIKNFGESIKEEPPDEALCNCGLIPDGVCFCGLSARS